MGAGPTAPSSAELIRDCVFMPVSSVAHLPSTNSRAPSGIPHYTPLSHCFALSMCVCLTYCCLFKLQFVNMRACVCVLSTRPLNHTPLTVPSPLAPSSFLTLILSFTFVSCVVCLHLLFLVLWADSQLNFLYSH